MRRFVCQGNPRKCRVVFWKYERRWNGLEGLRLQRWKLSQFRLVVLLYVLGEHILPRKHLVGTKVIYQKLTPAAHLELVKNRDFLFRQPCQIKVATVFCILPATLQHNRVDGGAKPCGEAQRTVHVKCSRRCRHWCVIFG